MEKRGDLRPDSKSDFNTTKRAEYYDENSHFVADRENKNKLKKPKKLRFVDHDIDEELD